MSHNLGKHIIVMLALLLVPVTLSAQTTGKIVGTISNESTGQGLAAAMVVIEGTQTGTAANVEGRYFILNVRPGVYNLRIMMMGFETKLVERVRVSVNRTTTIDVALKETAIQGEAVVVTANRVTIKKDQTSSVRNVSSEQIENMPVESVGDVVSMQAGVVDGHFRGGRISEVSYMIDGLPVTESFGGGGRSVDLEPESIEDLEVITGTFNAEYGKAMSGIVNAVTKTGGKHFSGSLAAHLGNYFTGNKDIFLGLDNTELDRNKDFRAQFSGPIWGDKTSFFANVRYQDSKNHLNGIRRFNPGDYSNYESINPNEWYTEHTGDSAFVAMNRSKNISFLGKLAVNPLRNVQMALLYTYNDDNWHGYDHAFKYNPDGMGSTHRTSNMLALEINHMLSKRMFYELKLSALEHDHGYYVFEDPYDSRYVHDRLMRSTGPGFLTGGHIKGHDTRFKKEYSGKLDFNWQITGSHFIKTGVYYIKHDLDNQYREIRNKYYGTQWEASLYEPITLPDSTIYSDIYRVKPIEFSGYIQDKMEFDEMVVNLGIRYDYFDPKTVYPSQRRNPANQLDFPTEPDKVSIYKNADPKIQISPRLGLSYQLGEAALLRFSYGHFFQMPPMYAMYQNHAFRVAPTDYSTTMGNAQLKAQKTVQYEIGLWQQLMAGMGLEVALFYRDIYDLLSAKVISTYNQIEYGLYSNKDYGNAKGLEVKYDLNMGHLGAFVNYTLQYTRGNADNPTQTFSRAGNSMDPVSRLIPMSWDQRHTVNLTMSYTTKDFGMTLTSYFNSGAPYTWSPISESQLSRVNLYPNNAVRPSRLSVDLSGYYNIPLHGSLRAKVTLNVYNLFDRLNEAWVNAETGRAYTAIIRETDLAAHHSDFNDFIDIVHNPSMYEAPRLVKLGLGIEF